MPDDRGHPTALSETTSGRAVAACLVLSCPWRVDTATSALGWDAAVEHTRDTAAPADASVPAH